MAQRQARVVGNKKTCLGCKRLLPKERFGPQEKGILGRSPRCRECANEAAVAIRQRFRDQVKVPVAEKRCSVCRKTKKPEDFYASNYSKDGLNWQCKVCHRTSYRAAKYGLTVEELKSMEKAQGGKCAACGLSMTRMQKGPHVDHCHKSGKVRGLLCSPCNVTLGHVRDDPRVLRALAAYLEKRHGRDTGSRRCK
jgi:hypothetical protein